MFLVKKKKSVVVIRIHLQTRFPSPPLPLVSIHVCPEFAFFMPSLTQIYVQIWCKEWVRMVSSLSMRLIATQGPNFPS